MQSIFKYFSIIWMLFIPVVVTAHEGHGLEGVNHYHPPFDLKIVMGLIVVGLIAIGVSYFLKSRK